jgi:glutamine---fructose-6-phosphate transaminase (isomerizing)
METSVPDPTTRPFDPEAQLPGAPDPWRDSSMPPFRDGPPFLMTEMMAAEPALAERLIARLAASGSAAAVLAGQVTTASEAGAPIRVVGCGTSEHAAMAAALILEDALRSIGLEGRVEAAQAFEAALRPQAGGLLVGVSHEGGTTATNSAIEAARDAGAATAMLTVSDRSPGARLVDVVVATDEADQSWCHTVGYLSPILAALAVAGHMTGVQPPPSDVRAALASGLEQATAADAIAARLADATTILTVASGADRPAARELALKIEEATWLPTTMRDLETLLHGHLPATGPETGLVLLLADADHLDQRAARAAQALAAAEALGLRTAAILSAEASSALGSASISAGRLNAQRPDISGPGAASIATATPLQLLTERLARARGTNPDAIRRLEVRYREAAALH